VGKIYKLAWFFFQVKENKMRQIFFKCEYKLGILILLLFIFSALPLQAETVVYSYDSVGRLIQAVYQDSGMTITYEYDAAGNMTKKTVTKGTTLIPEISLSTSKINFGATTEGQKTPDQQFRISNSALGTLIWSVADDAEWLTCTPSSGTGSVAIIVSADPSGLSAGTYNATITITSTNASNSPKTVAVTLTVKDLSDCDPPFGSFDTPVDGTTGVTGAIPVTGWVLDDIGIESVKIYRDKVDAEASISIEDLIYIGDAGSVEGARPDVEQGNPDFPVNNKAGWGYMILTNFLPGQGNGTYVLHAVATDKDGHEVSLGTKTIVCDNANAIKPFGTIDTPTQGAEISASIWNAGWALTPQTCTIPTDGSTIWIWVDGQRLSGHPAYNQYRNDIATLFPGFANTDGAVGAHLLDSTQWANGVHTIAWSVTDDCGRSDGIGSRFFTILNTGAAAQAVIGDKKADNATPMSYKYVQELPVNFEPILIKRGYRQEGEFERTGTDAYGLAAIEIRETERVEVNLGEGTEYRGGEIVGDKLRPLPIGSSLDRQNGIFYWQPGPGFLGGYDLVFVKQDKFGMQRKVNVRIRIMPKFSINESRYFRGAEASGEVADTDIAILSFIE
jgi:YD repeat-containing protein